MPSRASWIDRAAMGLSALCLVHCIGGTLLLAVLSSTGGLLFSHQIHAVGLALALPLAAFALYRGVRAHGRWLVAALGIAGLAAMAGALAEPHGQPSEIILTVCGVVLLASAHLTNLRSHA